jgi:hypothetical protein
MVSFFLVIVGLKKGKLCKTQLAQSFSINDRQPLLVIKPQSHKEKNITETKELDGNNY